MNKLQQIASDSKKKPNRKAINKMISVFDRHLEILEHIRTDKGMGSNSEVIRQALTNYHDKLYPNYIFHLSPSAKKKSEAMEKQAEIDATTPEQVAERLKAPIVVLPDGQTAIMVWGWSNTLRAILPEEIKEVLRQYPDIVDVHKSLLADRGMPEKFDKNYQWFHPKKEELI